MNKEQLRDAVRADAHRENYDDSTIDRFIREGESVLLVRLEAYELTVTLDDDDRPDTTSGIYTLPQRLTSIRYLLDSNGVPLDQVSESEASLYASAVTSGIYCKRPSTIRISGVPGEGAEFQLSYWGVPDALDADDDTNSLITDHPQLYKNLTMVGVYERMKAYDQAVSMLQKSNSFIDELNRRAKKALGGHKGANVYNTAFRSSY